MSANTGFTFEFLKEKFGKYVEINPATGNPRLISKINLVSSAVEMLGGVDAVAEYFRVPPLLVEYWIDQHYVPSSFAKDVASFQATGFSPEQLQRPMYGYRDPVSYQCWPSSYHLIDESLMPNFDGEYQYCVLPVNECARRQNIWLAELRAKGLRDWSKRKCRPLDLSRVRKLTVTGQQKDRATPISLVTLPLPAPMPIPVGMWHSLWKWFVDRIWIGNRFGIRAS